MARRVSNSNPDFVAEAPQSTSSLDPSSIPALHLPPDVVSAHAQPEPPVPDLIHEAGSSSAESCKPTTDVAAEAHSPEKANTPGATVWDLPPLLSPLRMISPTDSHALGPHIFSLGEHSSEVCRRLKVPSPTTSSLESIPERKAHRPEYYYDKDVHKAFAIAAEESAADAYDEASSGDSGPIGGQSSESEQDRPEIAESPLTNAAATEVPPEIHVEAEAESVKLEVDPKKVVEAASETCTEIEAASVQQEVDPETGLEDATEASPIAEPQEGKEVAKSTSPIIKVEGTELISLPPLADILGGSASQQSPPAHTSALKLPPIREYFNTSSASGGEERRSVSNIDARPSRFIPFAGARWEYNVAGEMLPVVMSGVPSPGAAIPVVEKKEREDVGGADALPEGDGANELVIEAYSGLRIPCFAAQRGYGDGDQWYPVVMSGALPPGMAPEYTPPRPWNINPYAPTPSPRTPPHPPPPRHPFFPSETGIIEPQLLDVGLEINSDSSKHSPPYSFPVLRDVDDPDVELVGADVVGADAVDTDTGEPETDDLSSLDLGDFNSSEFDEIDDMDACCIISNPPRPSLPNSTSLFPPLAPPPEFPHPLFPTPVNPLRLPPPPPSRPLPGLPRVQHRRLYPHHSQMGTDAMEARVEELLSGRGSSMQNPSQRPGQQTTTGQAKSQHQLWNINPELWGNPAAYSEDTALVLALQASLQGAAAAPKETVTDMTTEAEMKKAMEVVRKATEQTLTKTLSKTKTTIWKPSPKKQKSNTEDEVLALTLQAILDRERKHLEDSNLALAIQASLQTSTPAPKKAATVRVTEMATLSEPPPQPQKWMTGDEEIARVLQRSLQPPSPHREHTGRRVTAWEPVHLALSPSPEPGLKKTGTTTHAEAEPQLDAGCSNVVPPATQSDMEKKRRGVFEDVFGVKRS